MTLKQAAPDNRHRAERVTTGTKRQVFLQGFQTNKELHSFFSILSTNIAENGAEFVSTIEGYLVLFVLLHQTKSNSVVLILTLITYCFNREEISLLRGAVAS